MERINVPERLAEIRKRYAPGAMVEVNHATCAMAMNDLAFVLAILDGADVDFLCQGCRRIFTSIETLADHPGCKFWVMPDNASPGGHIEPR